VNRIFYRVSIYVGILILLSWQCLSQVTERSIEQRDKALNGIQVGTPKVYDDSVLQQMLSAAQARLVSLQVLDQNGIAARLGSITGANQQISSFALAIQGPSTPQSVLTANGATKQVVDTGTTTTTTTAPNTNVVTTIPQMNPPTATPPAPSTSLPSSFSVSASDILNEQLQLTFEIANLRLLLEGALSDRILRNATTHQTFTKARTTVGFPITIAPDRRFKDAVAVVEVEVEGDAAQDLSGNAEAPVITALLPREKTYNVAAIKDKSVSIGAGVATQIAGISGSYLFGRKTYYVVQDQDTVALTFKPANVNVRRIGFQWQFRPVLGESYVKAGLKQTFVQLSFPSPVSAPSFGTIHVRSYWRKYDRNTGILKEVVKGSLREIAADTQIPTFDMKQDTAAFSGANLEDLGNGQMLVTVVGNFLGGTYVRVGSTLLQAGSPGFTSEYGLIRFIAPIGDLATKKTSLVTRDGTEAPIVIKEPLGNPHRVAIRKAATVVKAIDEANSLLTLELDPVQTKPTSPLTLLIGGKVFGYTDAPIDVHNEQNKTVLSVVLPTSFLLSNPDVMVKPLMADDRFCGSLQRTDFCDKVTLFDPDAELERLALLEQGSSRIKYLLFGRNLDDVSVVQPTATPETSGASPMSGAGKSTASTATKNPPPRIEISDIGSASDRKTVRLLSVDAALAKTLKQIVLQRKGERPFLVAVPALPSADQAKSEPKFQERVTVGADEAVIVGDDLAKVTHVLFQKKELAKAIEGKSLRIKGLNAAGATATPTTQNIDLVTDTGKATVKLEVVNSKVESVPK
jgi:hypothetical protein